MKTTRVCSISLSALAFVLNASVGWAYSKPSTYHPYSFPQDCWILYDQYGAPIGTVCTNIYVPGTIVFKEQVPLSPHSWVIPKAISLLRTNGFDTEANLAQKYLLPMLEGVTFNDVWGDADLAGASVLDYYVPDKSDQDYGYGCDQYPFPFRLYKNCTGEFASHAFYGYGNAAEEAQYRYDYAKRIYLGHWGDDLRDKMGGWVIDDIGLLLQGQDDPMDGRWASGSNDIDNATAPDGTKSSFGTGHTPEQALQDLFLNYTQTEVVNPDESEDELRNIHVPTDEVFMHKSEWLDDLYNNADDVEAYNGWGGHDYAWYAAWTLDAGGGHCLGGSDCAAPMVCRFLTGSKAHAFFQLGWAIHLLEDNTTPVHTDDSSFDAFEVHNNVESMADYAIGSAMVNAGYVSELLPAATVSDFVKIYDWPPTPDDSDCPPKAPVNPSFYFYPSTNWYASNLPHQAGEGVAHAYVRNVAQLSHQYLDYITCIDTVDDHNWPAMGFFTAAGLDNAIKATAGLIRQFIEDVDKTPPTITITQPAATNYLHTATLTLNWSVSDDESGIKSNSVTATLDFLPLLHKHGLESGQMINLLTELTLGAHTFTVTAVDNARNTGSQSVTFTIVVTAQSIIDDVNYFFSIGAITQNEATSLLQKLTSAAKARAKGNCPNATTIYLSFISEVQAQSGKKIDPGAAAILIADAQYLIAHCP